ncbi:hypothetical protein F5X96DRAFT_673577 [Biscogniauxia mediterranea]|nr:hypothetical protein F5X96DRAFT_673577 [Biscogniauxia mediterranea]
MPSSLADQRADPPNSNRGPTYLTPIQRLSPLSLWESPQRVEALNINNSNDTNTNTNTGADHKNRHMAFLPIGLGYVLAYFSFFPAITRNVARRPGGDEHAQYEARLWWLLWTVPLLPLGLLVFVFAFAATTRGARPPVVHWIGSMAGSCLIGVANFAIYMATMDYVLRAYAAGGNEWARDFLAPAAVPPMYERLGVFPATTMMLFGVAVLFVLPRRLLVRPRAAPPPLALRADPGPRRGREQRPSSMPVNAPVFAGPGPDSVTPSIELRPFTTLSLLPPMMQQEQRAMDSAAKRMSKARHNRRTFSLSALVEDSE